ncbi:MAG: ribonuclease H-like domain-containing protein [Candidatus Aminicenantes bacterium]|nr:MAG: ribonuclease H-like domain-containing protein [Candidatus Aminicenantes bacterium]
MADIKDRLKQLKKEREARSKSQIVRETWEEIEKSGNISTKDKLQRLINLTREEKTEKPKVPDFEALDREPLQFLENPYPLDVRYGKITISSGLNIKGDILSYLSNDDAFKSLDLSTALFIDLETTGLSGGTGVLPFLVGTGYYKDDRFYVAQFFLGDPAEEERMIHELGQFFSQMNFQSVVTFNGKAFDIPILETRFILHREPFLLNELPHLDFLFPARSLWKHKYESCRLYNLALEVVDVGRSEDIPSAEIPMRYFQYLQTGNFELIEPILYHNQEDILSLLGVVVEGALIFSEERKEEPSDAMDFFGAGKIMEKVGEVERSVQFFKRALDGELSDEISLLTKKKLSCHFKRGQEWEKAGLLWKEITSSNVTTLNQLFSFRELAMYLEHGEKEFKEARQVAEEGLACSIGLSTYYEEDFRHRLERLKRKIQKQREKK